MKRFILPIILLLCIASVGKAQSHDAAHPTPLAGGNKGNVDNSSGPNYYYIYAGPGRTDLNLAFHETGVFGNPLRQNITFALTNEQGKVFFSQMVTSQGNLAKMPDHGTFDKRQRVLLTVSAQAGAIRLGGYYEFEITGAVFFDGKAGSSASAKPEDTSLTSTQKSGPVSLTSGPVALTSGAFIPKGYGAARPIAPNQKPNGQDDPAGRQLNRRVEMVTSK